MVLIQTAPHILNALLWLINNNIYYRDITIDLNVILELSET